MTDTQPRCQICGVYCGYYADSGTVYGCSSYDPPEPFDPEFWCKKCATKEYQDSLKEGEKMYVYWQMPMWQIKALKKLGLKKVKHKLVKSEPNTKPFKLSFKIEKTLDRLDGVEDVVLAQKGHTTYNKQLNKSYLTWVKGQTKKALRAVEKLLRGKK